MRLKWFRVRNYKSVTDSGKCYLASDITILAGKNEAGKTNILEALAMSAYTTHSAKMGASLRWHSAADRGLWWLHQHRDTWRTFRRKRLAQSTSAGSGRPQSFSRTVHIRSTFSSETSGSISAYIMSPPSRS